MNKTNNETIYELKCGSMFYLCAWFAYDIILQKNIFHGNKKKSWHFYAKVWCWIFNFNVNLLLKKLRDINRRFVMDGWMENENGKLLQHMLLVWG